MVEMAAGEHLRGLQADKFPGIAEPLSSLMAWSLSLMLTMPDLSDHRQLAVL